MCMIPKQSCTRTTRTSTCNSVLIVACCTNCPSNHLDLFACSLGSLRHQFDTSRVSFKRLDGLQLPKYVIFIYLDLVLFLHQYLGHSFVFRWHKSVLWCLWQGHCFKTLLSCLGISAWHVCSGNVLFINTDPVLLLLTAFIHISPMLLWCIISDIKCSGGCVKL